MKPDDLELWIVSLTTRLELYYSKEEPLNVNCQQTLHNCYEPLLRGHLGGSRRCSLNKGFTVVNVLDRSLLMISRRFFMIIKVPVTKVRCRKRAMSQNCMYSS